MAVAAPGAATHGRRRRQGEEVVHVAGHLKVFDAKISSERLFVVVFAVKSYLSHI